MTSEDPIPLDQDPMQSWIGLCTLGSTGTREPYLCVGLRDWLLHCTLGISSDSLAS